MASRPDGLIRDYSVSKPLRICHISASESAGGAGRAANRIHQEFVKSKFESQMLVMLRSSDNPTVQTPARSAGYIAKKLVISYADNLPLLLYKNRTRANFSPAIAQAYPLDRMDCVRNADLIILYWICAGFLNVKTVQKLGELGKPIIWRLSDMWPFTGGCHYSGDCEKYKERCGACPQLGSGKENDLSRRLWKKKMHKWKSIQFSVVCPSQWMSQCARESSLFKNKRIEVVPTGVDMNVFKPFDRQTARSLMGLPQGRKLALFGSLDSMSDTRKGGRLLQDTLITYSKSKDNPLIDLVIFGSSRSPAALDGIFNTHTLGILHDEVSLALLYNACDVFVAPSREENLANTVLESLACGTPCVAFEIGGMPDMIEHKGNGYLARPFDVEDLARGISWILEDRTRYDDLCKRTVNKIEHEFNQKDAPGKYISLYEKILRES